MFRLCSYILFLSSMESHRYTFFFHSHNVINGSRLQIMSEKFKSSIFFFLFQMIGSGQKIILQQQITHGTAHIIGKVIRMSAAQYASPVSIQFVISKDSITSTEPIQFSCCLTSNVVLTDLQWEVGSVFPVHKLECTM